MALQAEWWLQPRIRQWARWAFVVAVLGVLVLALWPLELAPAGLGWDKANHALAFAVLTVLGGWGWPQRLGLVVVWLLGYGVLIEALQALTPNRMAQWEDVAADALGVLLGGLVLRCMCRRFE